MTVINHAKLQMGAPVTFKEEKTQLGDLSSRELLLSLPI